MQKLDARVPWIGAWLGDRLDLELPAYMVSLTAHAVLLVGLALAGHRVHQAVQREFRSEVPDSSLAGESTFQDLDQSAEPPALVPAAGSFAPNLAMTITSAPSSAGAVPGSAVGPAPAAGPRAPGPTPPHRRPPPP